MKEEILIKLKLWVRKKEILSMAKKGSSLAQMRAGLYYFEKGDYKRGCQWLQKSAE